MHLRILHIIILVLCAPLFAAGQKTYARKDSLRGTLNAERTWWDVRHYALSVRPDFETKSISGSVTIRFVADGSHRIMQLDLQEPMQIDLVRQSGRALPFTREGNVYRVDFGENPLAGSPHEITVNFSGRPVEALRPPWDGGWIWKTDAMGRPWMSVACQGVGASVWWPCKDHQSDEPEEGASLSITAPDHLTSVGNGRFVMLKSIEPGWVTTTWAVTNPISTYTLIPYIGHYTRWTEDFEGEKGTLPLTFWVLDYDEEKARSQFAQTAPMLRCFEHWFGPYPFYEDGYQLVQAPHLGMEHQSAVAYGNGFRNGYLGMDLSGTGRGLEWDYILIHESGHEWFGNNITTRDIADMWVHEAFTSYSECIYSECHSGREAGSEYIIGTRKRNANDKPIIGPYGVNGRGSNDMYHKGANMIHTMRQLMDDDEKFRQMLREMNRTFANQTVTTAQIENFIIAFSGQDFTKIFDQYLRHAALPVLEWKMRGKKIKYRWTGTVKGFDMQVKIDSGEWIGPTGKWKKMPANGRAVLTPDKNFYIVVREAGK